MPLLQQEDLVDLAATIWQAVLGRTAVRVDEAPAAEPGAITLTACVAITGGWRGTVELVMDLSAAVHCARHMCHDDDGDDLPQELIDDAVGELANIAAGNLKGMLAENTRLGLPTIVRGRDYEVSIPGAHVVCQAAFDFDGHPFRLVVQSPSDLPVLGWRNEL